MGNEIVAMFLDFENLYYSSWSQCQVEPDPKEIMAYANSLGHVVTASAFAPFEQLEHLRQIRPILQGYAIETHDTPFTEVSPGVKKDYTDFMMLDAIYHTAMTAPHVTTFIFGTGDGHFQKAAATLINLHKKRVILLTSSEESTSDSLRNIVSDVHVLRNDISDGLIGEVENGILSIMRASYVTGHYCTFKKTTEYYAMKNSVRLGVARKAMRGLLDRGVVTQKNVEINGLHMPALFIS